MEPLAPGEYKKALKALKNTSKPEKVIETCARCAADHAFIRDGGALHAHVHVLRRTKEG